MLGQVQVLPPTTPLVQIIHTPANSVTCNYSTRVTVLCARLEGQTRCLLPVSHRASPPRLHPQSDPLAPRPAVSPPVVCFVLPVS